MYGVSIDVQPFPPLVVYFEEIMYLHRMLNIKRKKIELPQEFCA